MKVAIDVADLDCERIDGTRVYIKNVLKYLGKLSSEDEFFLFHKKDYNESLQPAKFENYVDEKIGKGFWWTQIKFARALKKMQKEKCGDERLICWMPIQQIPFFNFQTIFKFIIFKIWNLKTPQNLRSSDFNPLHREKGGQIYTGGGSKIKYVVTIHDLAFKFFPKHFPLIDRLKINFYTDIAIKRADKIIAISKATKKDIIKLYPKVDADKIQVVYHGFDRENFRQKFDEREKAEFLQRWGLSNQRYKKQETNKLQETRDKQITRNKRQINYKKQETNNDIQIKFESKVENQKSKVKSRKSKVIICDNKGVEYLLYVGAIQPRKDLITLIRAFENLKKDKSGKYANLKLVLAGEIAWKSDLTIKTAQTSEFKNDIIMTGKVSFKELALFYCLAKIFVFPSLYEGFGIPLLEAMASETPVVVADNSSLIEVGGEAVLKFKSKNSKELTKQLKKLLDNTELQQKMVKRGLKRIKKFSWEKCAKETLKVLKNDWD